MVGVTGRGFIARVLPALFLSLGLVFAGAAAPVLADTAGKTSRKAEAPKLPPEEKVLYGGRVPKVLRKAHVARLKELRANKIDRKKLSRETAEKGWDLLADSKYGEATRLLNDAWLLDGRNPRVFWGFALVRHFRDNNKKGADAMFRRARVLDPRDTELLMDYAHFLAETRRIGPSIGVYKKVVKINPKAANAHRGLALAYLQTKRFKLSCKHVGLARDAGKELEKNIVMEISLKAKTSC